MKPVPTAPWVSAEEYLSTDYSPDCDYVEGVLEDRNVGEYEHAKLQKRLIVWLAALEKMLPVHVLPEQRVQVRPSRFRVPDVCVVVGPEPDEPVLTQAPFLCVEILSREDRMVRMQEKIGDYLALGVRHVWVVNPAAKAVYVYTAMGVEEVRAGVLRTTGEVEMTMPLAELFG